MSLDRNHWISLPFLLLGLCFFASSAFALQEDAGETESDDGLEPAEKMVTEEVRKEIDTICSVEVAMEIERYRNFFKLDDDVSEKLKESGKQIVEAHVKKYTDVKILETWGQVGQAIGAGAGASGVVINGRACWFEEDSEVDEDALPQVSMCLFRTTMLFMLKFDSGTTTTYMQYQIKFKPTESEQWKDALSFLTDEDFARYHEHRNAIKREKAIKLILSALSVQLKLTEDQIEPTRIWIGESMGDEEFSQREIYSVAKKGFELLSDPPECFSEEQKKVMAGIKASFER